MSETNYRVALEHAQAEMAKRDPARAARNADVRFTPLTGTFEVAFWGTTYSVAHPSGEVVERASSNPAATEMAILILHYLATADGMPSQERWVAFRELPGGMLYDSAFQADVRRTIATRFGHDLDAFFAAGEALGGQPLEYGDASYQFAILPHLDAAVILSVADDEFPAQARILYDASAAHYLPMEDLAVMGELIGRRLVAHANAS